MRIEPLIETPETRRAKRRLAYTRAQYFCFGTATAALAGAVDPWWKDLHVMGLFLTIGILLGIAKVRSCRPGRRPPVVLNPIALPEA